MSDIAGADSWLSRPATDADRTFCWHLHVQTMRDYVEATWGWDETDQRERFERAFNAAGLRIVEVDGLPVGVLRVDASDVPVRLLSIAVAPSHQRCGLGTALVEHVVREAGVAPVWLQVLKANPARRLYERLGFVVIEETATHWQMVLRPAS